MSPLMKVLNRVYGPSIGAAIADLLATTHAGLVLANTLARGGTAKAPIALPLPPAQAAATALTAAAAASAVAQLAANVPDAPGLTNQERVTFMRAVSVLRTASSLMTTSFRERRHYPDFANLYGSALASSLTEGQPASPWRGLNPFAEIVPVSAPHVTQTVDAIHAARALARADYVVDPPMLPATIAAYAHAIANGTSFVEA